MSFMSPPPPGFRARAARPASGPETTDDAACDALPPDDTVRWVPSRKLAVLNAINSGHISLEEACRRWRLSVEEIQLWQRAVAKAGAPGLRVTRVQIYRPLFEPSGDSDVK